MNNTDSNSKQNDQQTIPASFRLALTSSILTTIADGLAVLAALSAIDELKIAEEKEKQDAKDLDEKFQKLQLQINKLTKELSKMKSQSYR
jgi:cell division protein ZapA (FtsZ GTPase activity inhibitor)